MTTFGSPAECRCDSKFAKLELRNAPSGGQIICSGYFDLATPFGATDYTINQMPLGELRKNISHHFYEGGHMLYLNHPALAKLHGATLFLLHVEEGVTSQIYGKESSTAEVEAGEEYLERIAQTLRAQGISVETAISHSTSPKREIVRFARQMRPDLVIMGAHGHGGLKDLIFGNTINPVRHDLELPMLIVRPGKNPTV